MSLQPFRALPLDLSTVPRLGPVDLGAVQFLGSPGFVVPALVELRQRTGLHLTRFKAHVRDWQFQ